MGNTYQNVTIYGPTQTEVAAVLNQLHHRAFVAPTVNGFTTVFDADKWQELYHDTALTSPPSREERQALERKAQAVCFDLSSHLNCAVLAVSVYDDDVLSYQLIVNGELVDTYHSTGVFEAEVKYEEAMAAFYESDDADLEMPELNEETSSNSVGGAADKLCAILGAPDATEQVRVVLHESEHTFEVFRHQELVEALRLPIYAVGCGFNYISRGELPQGLAADDLIETGLHS